MAKISDEIRNDFVRGDGVDVVSYRKLLSIADRIDAEMMELPRDRDGVPIHVGDTVYLDDGRVAKVTRIGIGVDEDSMCVIVYGDNFSLTPGYVSHTKPDSWGRIAQDMEDWAEEHRAGSETSDVFDRALGFADRVRKLAEKEGE